ncbi:MAG: phage tail tape measure protein [Alphaproteobacteria bacterium]
MTTPIDTVSVAIVADTGAFKREIAECDTLAKNFGRSMTSALTTAATRGQGLNGVLDGIGRRLSSAVLRAAMRPIQSAISRSVSGLFSGGQGEDQSEGVLDGTVSDISPFARGGVVSAPTYFPMNGDKLGLMGEAGAEAILPLSRGPDGRLGVATQGGGGSPSVVFNVSTPDAASFRRSEAEITAMLARTVSRGRRGT